MKKSVKEQVAQKARGRTFCAYTGEPEYEYWSVDVPDVMRIIRRACKEAYEAGYRCGNDDALRVRDGLNAIDDGMKHISVIINGPKKANRPSHRQFRIRKP